MLEGLWFLYELYNHFVATERTTFLAILNPIYVLNEDAGKRSVKVQSP